MSDTYPKHTGLCQNPNCKKPLFNGLKYCDRLCCNRASSEAYRLRNKDKPAKAKQASGCTHEVPSYAKTCLICFKAKVRREYKENKKYYLGLGTR